MLLGDMLIFAPFLVRCFGMLIHWCVISFKSVFVQAELQYRSVNTEFEREIKVKDTIITASLASMLLSAVPCFPCVRKVKVTRQKRQVQWEILHIITINALLVWNSFSDTYQDTGHCSLLLYESITQWLFCCHKKQLVIPTMW